MMKVVVVVMPLADVKSPSKKKKKTTRSSEDKIIIIIIIQEGRIPLFLFPRITHRADHLNAEPIRMNRSYRSF